MGVCQPCGANLNHLTRKTLTDYSLKEKRVFLDVYLCPDCNSLIAGNKEDANSFLKRKPSYYGKQIWRK